jgi:hypothetical protein
LRLPPAGRPGFFAHEPIAPEAWDNAPANEHDQHDPSRDGWRLLGRVAGIRSQLIDVVVVYELDRLTRSLADFAPAQRARRHRAKVQPVERCWQPPLRWALGARSGDSLHELVEIFDAHGISVVSVTQSFNTTISMGKLTLKMLLSFAQFERERIRDKIAASKRCGIWVGGIVR